LGEETKYAQQIFLNPLTPLVCPVFSLGLYLMCCFNTCQASSSTLFLGIGQDSRFSTILGKLLKGFNNDEVGTHSIQKGLVSYLVSLPGGHPAASICISAGWTMGRVKGILMQYVVYGDQFVGRCLSL
jgi:hypothetical protein